MLGRSQLPVPSQGRHGDIIIIIKSKISTATTTDTVTTTTITVIAHIDPSTGTVSGPLACMAPNRPQRLAQPVSTLGVTVESDTSHHAGIDLNLARRHGAL